MTLFCVELTKTNQYSHEDHIGQMGVTTSREEQHSPLTRKRRMEKIETMMEERRTLRYFKFRGYVDLKNLHM